MNFSRYEVRPRIWLDSRRAAWFESERVLVVADLHLGYPWGQRALGQLLPFGAPDDTIERLQELQRCYEAAEIVLLGDIIHRAVDVPWLRGELARLTESLSSCTVHYIAGNHDRHLASLLKQIAPHLAVRSHIWIGPHLLTHGDDARNGQDLRAPRPEEAVPAEPGLAVMGHEHPAISLGDGLTTAARCPCFLVGPRILILPAFSSWAAGADIRRGQFMNRAVRQSELSRAIAIVGEKLLPLPL
jgi:putative SbcD/Mre11-related phosphoesterase